LSRGNRRDPAIPLMFSLHSDEVGVSRLREKQERLRRDVGVGYRGVTSGLTSEAHEVSRHPSEVIAE
ncbi:MAG: hypothetical protein WBK65_10630, partial [Thermotogota bacterium]